MAKHNKKIMNHHKRNHNGRQRAKNDVPKSVDRTYVLAAAVRKTFPTVKAIAHAIRISRPTMEWSATLGRWVPHVAKHIKRRFGRCMRHFDLGEDMNPIRPPLREHPEVSELTENEELNTQEY